MIVRCGGYPNVPLLGTQGAINYNPELASRQARYAMIRVPQEEVMDPFVLHGLEAHRGEKGVTWRAKSYGASPSYRAWLENRIKLVGLLGGKDQEARAYEVQETLRIGELEDTLEQMKVEQGVLKRRLETALEEVCLERQLKNETNKRARAKRETLLKVTSYLKATNQELCSRRMERDQVVAKKEQLEEALRQGG
ncbi:hypothetical protein CR513_43642, partial [Mucuna pruriens]